MTDHAEPQHLPDLVLAMSATAASIASAALWLALPFGDDDPSDAAVYLNTMRAKITELEAYYCALMNYSGVSWDVLATYYDVSRQALHRRLSSHVQKGIERARNYPAVHYNDLIRELALIQSAAGSFTESPRQTIADAAQIWQERQEKADWWLSERE
jgi:hypothetical protein